MPGVVKHEHIFEKCPKCNGTGAPFLIPRDPTSGHDLQKLCDACVGSGLKETLK